MTAFQAVLALLAVASGLGVLSAFGLVVFARILGRVARTTGLTPSPGGRPAAYQAVFVRFRDPDTAGRPRPRAPSVSPAPI